MVGPKKGENEFQLWTVLFNLVSRNLNRNCSTVKNTIPRIAFLSFFSPAFEAHCHSNSWKIYKKYVNMLIYLDGEVVLSDSDPGESADDLSDDELIADKIKVPLEEYNIYNILESDLVWLIHRAILYISVSPYQI